MTDISIENLVNDPTLLFTSTNTKDETSLNCDSLLKSLKDIVDPLIKTSEDCVLDEIYLDGLDATQVWGQVKLVFDGVEKEVIDDIDALKSQDSSEDEDEMDEEIGEEEEEEEEADNTSSEAEVENDESNESLENDKEDEENKESDEESEEENGVEDNDTAKSNDYGLNDEFFNLDDYKRQVLALEDNNFDDDDDGDDEEVDLFADLDDDDDDDEMYTYNDFFDAKGSKTNGKTNHKNDSKKSQLKSKNRQKEELGEEDYDAAYDLAQADIYGEDGESEEVEEESDNSRKEEKLSTFEKQQREIQRQIAELEAESIAEKKWTMKGEVSGKQREADTLLDEELEFDRTAKPVPIITQEVTESIEDIIKRRIVNQEFDDIPKRLISEINNFKPSKKVEVSEQKSTKSLAELYEDEYSNTNGNGNGTTEVDEVLKAAHDEISELFKDVTYQLDSLYSSHFVPKPKEKLLDVRIETPTIAMEDAQPLTMASSNSLAPQEIYKVGTKVGKDEVVLKSGVVMAKAELERDDKQRLHRAKKRKQHLQNKDESLKKKKIETKQL